MERRRYPSIYSNNRNYGVCLCGCKAETNGKALYASSACRKRVQRRKDREARDVPDPLTKALAEPARAWRNRDPKPKPRAEAKATLATSTASESAGVPASSRGAKARLTNVATKATTDDPRSERATYDDNHSPHTCTECHGPIPEADAPLDTWNIPPPKTCGYRCRKAREARLRKARRR